MKFTCYDMLRYGGVIVVFMVDFVMYTNSMH